MHRVEKLCFVYFSQVVGWGVTQDHERSFELKKAVLHIDSHRDCYLMNRAYFSSRLKPGQNFCAGVKGESNHNTPKLINIDIFTVSGSRVCSGDSGGGFAIEGRNHRWFLRGVVSYGDAQERVNQYIQTVVVCDGTLPSFFVDLTYYMDWIVSNTDFSP